MSRFHFTPENRTSRVVMTAGAVLAGLYFAVLGFSQVIRQHSLFMHEVAVQGRIVSSRLMKAECAACPDWRQVIYGYSYRGQSHTGERLWPLGKEAYNLQVLSWGNAADVMEERFMADARPGRELAVYLDGRDPGFAYVFSFYGFGPCVFILLGLAFAVFGSLALARLFPASWPRRRGPFLLAAFWAWTMLNGAAIGEYFLCGPRFMEHASISVFYAVAVSGTLGGSAYLLVSFLRRPGAAADE